MERVVKAIGKNYPISKKHSVAICRFIKGKKIGECISLLEKVRMKKIAVPIKGRAEVPHRKGMERGRFPVKASFYFIKLLKNLRGNALVKNLDPESVVIKIAKADKGETPTRVRRRGWKGKRTHILLIGEGKEIKEKKGKSKSSKEQKEKVKEKDKTSKEKAEKKEEKGVKLEKEEQKEESKEEKKND